MISPDRSVITSIGCTLLVCLIGLAALLVLADVIEIKELACLKVGYC